MVFFFSFSILFFQKQGSFCQGASFEFPPVKSATSQRQHKYRVLPDRTGLSLLFLFLSLVETWSVEKVSNKAHSSPHPPTQLISLQSAKLVAHVGDAVTWNRASFLCLYTEILRRMQCFTQKKRDSMQGLHSTHQLLKCLIMWEPLCAHLQRSVWQSWRVICVQNHAVCVQTVAPEVNAKTPPV